MARPSKFEDIDIDLVSRMVREGYTDAQIAKACGVAYSTFRRWSTVHPEFSAVIKSWKDEADAVVERSLYERAKGYSHPEDKIFNDNGEPIVVPTVKHYPPDTTACIFWLKNRKRAEWRDRTEIDNTHKIDSLDKLLDEIDGNRWQPKGGE